MTRSTSAPERDSRSETDSPSIAVVGGGAVGVTAAVDLASRGADVTLYERGDLAAESSGRAAGVLYDAYAEDVDAALAARAMERFRSFGRSLPGFTFTPCPYVIAVREGDPDADAVPSMVDRMRAHGRDVSVVDPSDLADRFPISVDDLAVAAVAEGAGWCDPASYVAAMGRRAHDEGVAVETGTAVSLTDGDVTALRVDAEGGSAPETREFDAVVVAAGAHTADILAGAGIAVPVVPYRVQALTSRIAYDGPMVYDATAGVYLRPHPTGLLAGDGTEPVAADPEEYDRAGDDWFVESVSETLRERVDAVGGEGPDVERAWAGLCTATPDGDPLVGPVGPVGDERRGRVDGADRLFVAAGWQGHGFMRAPATGELVAEGVLASLGGDESEASASPWIDAFAPDRFDGDETVEIVEGMSIEGRLEG
ncbi:FAD-dependent oxidoreductase [Halorubrum sp. AD140]|uniref:NAD(P)/FAD-dependent oxidoreductase n=1 Tax=Halorubrum sp. AD140 TaxID=3050073 RepID=UPI002ACC9820|nr:FAD-dependent oxidoreductase [Halorubrum sp. AD140]MDZ5811954.1 FAD-dependent oxidoreductase [Halorubrum sp. AD140]